MVRLPRQGEDVGEWGEILNDFLLKSHNQDGTLKDNSVSAAALSTEAIVQMSATYDATQYGLIGDGTTDDAPAFQALINNVSSDGGGFIYLPRGRYRLIGGVKWRSNVSLRGDGIGLTVLLPDDQGTKTGVPAIGYDKATVSSTNPMQNCYFSDFEIDGSKQTLPYYHVQNKGIFIQYCRNMVFRDIYIHDTIATGMGPDFLDNVVIDHVKTYNCGKLWAPGQNGGSGIGIGTGGMQNENFSIVNCQTDYSGQYGIFVEDQIIFGINPHYTPRGSIIANNIVKNGRNVGIGVIGGINTSITGNIVYGNTSHGFRTANDDSMDISLVNNHFYNNGGAGIISASNANYTAYTIKSNKFRHNATYHIQLGGKILDSVTVSDNDIKGGNLGGIKIDPLASGFSRLSITNNTIHQTSGHGIFMAASGVGVDISGNLITSNQGSAIFMSSSMSKAAIISNKMWGNTSYAVEQPAAASTNDAMISGNEVRGNTLGQLSLNGNNTNLLLNEVQSTNNKPRFIARNTNSSNPVANVWTKATMFNSEVYDAGNMYDPVIGRFKCADPATVGTWSFTSVISQNVSSGDKLVVALYKNGVIHKILGRGSSAITDVCGFGGSAIVDIALNDYIEVYYFTTSSLSFASAVGYSSFEGIKVN